LICKDYGILGLVKKNQMWDYSDLLQEKISVDTINKFLPKRFSILFPDYMYPGYGDYQSNESDLLWEMEDYGLTSIHDINKIIPLDFEEAVKTYNLKMNYLSLLRIVMLLHNHKKYIEVYNEIWDLSLLKDLESFFNFYNLDVDEIAKQAKTK